MMLLVGFVGVLFVVPSMAVVAVLVMPYWEAERRGRARWALEAPRAELALPGGPYRTAVVVRPAVRRARAAPLLVRAGAAAAIVLFWTSFGGGLVLAARFPAFTPLALLVAWPLAVVAYLVARRLLAREAAVRTLACWMLVAVAFLATLAAAAGAAELAAMLLAVVVVVGLAVHLHAHELVGESECEPCRA